MIGDAALPVGFIYWAMLEAWERGFSSESALARVQVSRSKPVGSVGDITTSMTRHKEPGYTYKHS